MDIVVIPAVLTDLWVRPGLGGRGGRPPLTVRLVSWADTLADVARSLYVTSPEAETGNGTVAVGAVDLLTRPVGRVGVFRPVVRSDEQPDPLLELLLDHEGVDIPHDLAVG
jgi:hypothetical protein